MLSSSQLLWFFGGLFALLGIVPAAVWLATGSLVQAQRALKGYGQLFAALVTLLALGGLIGVIGAAFSS